MRSVEFFTYLLPTAEDSGSAEPLSRKLTRWQAIAWPGATPVEGSREVRVCPESAEELQALGFDAPPVQEPPTRVVSLRRRPRRGAHAGAAPRSR